MNFIAHVFNQLKKLHAQPILYHVAGEEIVAYSAHQFLTMIMNVRGVLRQKNILSSARVALLAPNSPEWLAIDLALIAEGIVVVPLYHRMSQEELAKIINDCQPAFIIVANETLAKLLPVNPIPRLTYRELFDNAIGFSFDMTSTFQIKQAATIIYTSGTSGEPKGVMLTAQNILYMCQQTSKHLARLHAKLQITAPRLFHFLPLAFAGSRLMLWTQLFLGEKTYLSADLELTALKKIKPHYFLCVPLVLERIKQKIEMGIRQKSKLIQFIYQRGMAVNKQTSFNFIDPFIKLFFHLLQKKIKKQIGSQLKFLMSGSAPLNPETQRWFVDLGIPIYQIYGLTETTGIISIDDPENVSYGYVGFPLANEQIKINEDHELFCRGPHLFSGYWNNPAATAAVLKDGWFKTGDKAELDHEGRIKIIGRSKEILVLTSGHKVAPEMLEQQLLSIQTDVEHVMIIGHERPFLCALVTGQISQQQANDMIMQFNNMITHYQKIRLVKKLETKFTIENGLLTANGKLKRNKITQVNQALIEEMYA